jgi:acetyltransferase-like isoleucine patch superfamily enzyme
MSHSPTPPLPSGAPRSLVSRFLAEARDAVATTDPRRAIWHAGSWLLPDFAFPGVRAQLLRSLGCDIRRGVAVLGNVHIVGPRHAPERLRIGPGSILGPGVTFCLDAAITVGSAVSIGPRVLLYTATHSIGPSSRRMHPGVVAQPIVIEDGVWVGLAAVILPGVRLGKGCVVAAGAVVTQNVPPNVLVSGNPARVLEPLPSGGR